MAIIKHTRSTSGRIHRLTVTSTAWGTETVELRYKEGPRFDDRVEGDLVRKYWAEGGQVKPIGPCSAVTDKALDAVERDASMPTPEQVAEAALRAAPWRHPGVGEMSRNDTSIAILIASAIRADRAIR